VTGPAGLLASNTALADRRFEMVLRNRVVFGVGSSETIPEFLVLSKPSRVFIVTDPGVRRAGIVDPILHGLRALRLPTDVFDEVEPNPAAATVERGAERLRSFGTDGAIVVAIGGGSAMDAAKAIDLRAMNDRPVWELEYDGPDLTPGRPIIAVPTTAGTGSEAHSFGVITREEVGRKDYIGHPSLLPMRTVLDPGLTVGLPPAVTAATGIDAMTHSLESLLSRNPNPFAEAMALAVIRTVSNWLELAVADGSSLEARSQLLVASHLAGVGQASGTGVGLVHALGHAIGTRGKVAHGTALAAVLPEVLSFYLGLRDRELSLVGEALGVASRAESHATGAVAAIGAIRAFCGRVGQRPSLRSLGLDDAMLDAAAQDAIDDAAIRNSPRLPTYEEARAILATRLD
jgi:alcohol dehydrogenase class IV